jgi:hypothetical protein
MLFIRSFVSVTMAGSGSKSASSGQIRGNIPGGARRLFWRIGRLGSLPGPVFLAGRSFHGLGGPFIYVYLHVIDLNPFEARARRLLHQLVMAELLLDS